MSAPRSAQPPAKPSLIRSLLTFLSILLVCALLPALLLQAGLFAGYLHAMGGQPAHPAAVADDARTRYPIVLAHGLMGYGYIGSQAYFTGIPEALETHGAKVFVTQVSALNSSEVRGEQLLAQVQRILRETGAGKVNLIGHSHGSQAVRYVAGMRPDLVASVTAVSGPTKGSETADLLLQTLTDHPAAASAVFAFANAMGRLVSWASGQDELPQDAHAATLSLSSAGAADFNARFPAGVPDGPCNEGVHEAKGIRLYSWMSVGRFYRPLNPADSLMWLTGLTFHREADNDGLVGRCASHFGQVIRDDYPMNHFHAVNEFWGMVPHGIDVVGLYLEHARRLKAAGL